MLRCTDCKDSRVLFGFRYSGKESSVDSRQTELESPVSYRWTICALLFVATTINYVDRQVLGILAPTLQRELHWTEADYGNIVSWFSFAYAFGFLVAGLLWERHDAEPQAASVPVDLPIRAAA